MKKDFIAALRNADVEAVKGFIAAGEDLNEQYENDGDINTPLYEALVAFTDNGEDEAAFERRKAAVVEMLVEAGANPNVRGMARYDDRPNPFHRSLIFTAVGNCGRESLRAFMASGARHGLDEEARDSEGRTVAWKALSRAHQADSEEDRAVGRETLRDLAMAFSFAHGEYSLVDRYGTPFLFAAIDTGDPELVRLLKGACAPDVCNPRGVTAAAYARRKGEAKIAEALEAEIRERADPHFREQD
ncbi:hypothetical protein [Pyramidobacter piscolens]|uniref:hypothetical protein n=2 Tax=Pyramidobacter piscolens TaxID=638849 RepID=UPI002AAF5E81|nr:hypothetical protein [Pyramidobacter piscolens]